MTRIAEERETVIRFCDAEEVVHIWSASPTFIRHMKRLGVEPWNIGYGQKPGDESYSWKVTQDWITVHLPRKVREYTPEERAAAAERLRSARERQSNTQENEDDLPKDEV